MSEMWKCPKCGRELENEEQKHFCGKIITIDDYINDQPVEVQPLLQAIRKTIHVAAPNAIEKISWKMPTFWQGENLVHFAAFKKHIGLYPGGEAVGVFATQLEGYKTSKGTIQFPLNRLIDHQLIADIVSWRVSQVECGMSLKTEPEFKVHSAMPNFITDALNQCNLWERYNARPPYQQEDYIGWITGEKQEKIQQKRLYQMLEELKVGNAYMGMVYSAKGEE